MNTVLVMDGGLPKTLPVLRSLATAGVRVLVAAATTASAASASSRYCSGLVRHPPLDRDRDCIDALVDGLRRERVDVLLPLDDAHLRLLSAHRARLEPVAHLAMPTEPALSIALDKRQTLLVAAAVADGIRLPRWYQSPDAAIDCFPVVVKPRTSWGAVGIRYVGSHAQLGAAYAEVDRDYPDPLVQELIPYEPGDKYQLLYLFDADGTLRSCYMHRILVEMDGIEGGADAARTRGGNALAWQSWRDPRLLRDGQNLLGALGWRGFGFVECVRDRRDGEVKLMEINARMSGTIGLPLAEGVNFALGACQVACGLMPPDGPEFRPEARARHSLFGLLGAGGHRAVAQAFDHRVRRPNRVLADLRPYLVSGAHRLAAGLRRLARRT